MNHFELLRLTWWNSGLGTGYLTACFAIMVGPQGRAVGVEHIPELVDKSIKNIQNSAAAPLLEEGSLLLHAGGMLYLSFLGLVYALSLILFLCSPFFNVGLKIPGPPLVL